MRHFTNTPHLSCNFDRSVSMPAVFMDEKRLWCYAPAMDAGNYELRITNNDHDYSSESLWFSFHNPIKVHFIHPTFGMLQGGTTVNVYGAHFYIEKNNFCDD